METTRLVASICLSADALKPELYDLGHEIPSKIYVCLSVIKGHFPCTAVDLFFINTGDG